MRKEEGAKDFNLCIIWGERVSGFQDLWGNGCVESFLCLYSYVDEEDQFKKMVEVVLRRVSMIVPLVMRKKS